MLNYIDNLLNRITMYRLVLYYLIFLLAVACLFGSIGWLSYAPTAILFEAVILVAICLVANKIFVDFFQVSANLESVYITALILALLITPPADTAYFAVLPLLFMAGILAMASKFIFNIGQKHIFNPVAIAIALTALAANQSATWWIGSPILLPFVLLGGILVIRKVRRFDAVISFVAAAIIAMFVLPGGGANPWLTVYKSLIHSPLIFLAAVMLTEPLTMPPTRDGRIAYGLLVGWLFAPQTHFGGFYFTPELALITGNIFSYLVSPKGRYVLTLKSRAEIGQGIYDFVFESDRPLSFRPGQYLEFTIDPGHADTRGNRRYFTIASSPTEKEMILGIRFYQEPSSFKRKLLMMEPGDKIMAGQLAGDFVLPRDPKKKLVFLAGGIGVTPFRSMLKYLVDRQESRPITMLYSNREAAEIVYQEVTAAAERLGMKTVNVLTGQQGYINEELIKREVPDYLDRTFYISGSHNMVTTFKRQLTNLGVHRSQIVTDFFPGLA